MATVLRPRTASSLTGLVAIHDARNRDAASAWSVARMQNLARPRVSWETHGVVDAMRSRRPRLVGGSIVLAALAALCLVGRQCRPDVEPAPAFAPQTQSPSRTATDAGEGEAAAASTPSQDHPSRQAVPVRRRIEPVEPAPPIGDDGELVVVRVLNSAGAAAAGAEVRLHGWSRHGRGQDGAARLGAATADARGEVRMSIRTGDFVASAALGRAAAASGPHDSRATHEVVLHLERGVAYSVRPEDDDGLPIVGVHVELRVRAAGERAASLPPGDPRPGAPAPDGSWLEPCLLRFQAVTGEDGVAHFPTLPAHDGGCELTTISEKEGHRTVVTRGRKQAKVAGYESRPWLLEAASFKGRLLSSDGTALTDIKFIVGRGQQFQARIDDDGMFTVPNSPRRAGVARVWSAGHVAREVPWDPSLQGTIDLGEIRLVPTPTPPWKRR